jgi:hypothetical protein
MPPQKTAQATTIRKIKSFLVVREGIEDRHYLAESEDIFEEPDKVTPNLNP